MCLCGHEIQRGIGKGIPIYSIQYEEEFKEDVETF